VASPNDPFRTTAPHQGGTTLSGLLAQASRLSAVELANLAVADLRERWRSGERVPAEAYLSQLPTLHSNTDGLLDLIYGEILAREELGESPDVAEYVRRFPEHESALRRQFNLHGAVKSELQKQLGGKETATLNAKADTRDHSAPPRRAGDQLQGQFGRYRIEKLLGKGGMGTVYLAHDSQLDRLVALKVMRFAATDSEHGRDRFFREARAAATLEHPNICQVYDVGTIDGIHYLTMAYIEGQSLTAFTKDGQRLAPRQVAILGRQLALALAEAHQHGIIHRDLKPSNVMLNRRQQPVLMDFGLARSTKTGDERLTRDGQALGTPAYMPPEQVNGDLEAMGPGCDIYSLGVMLFELLTGRTPFRGTVAEVMAQVLREEPPRPSTLRPGLDRRLDAICAKAMAKKIAERYASMSEMAAALAEYAQEGGPVTDAPLFSSSLQSTEVSAVKALPTTSPKKAPVWPWLVAAAVLIAGTVGAFTLLGRGNRETPAPSQLTAVPTSKPSASATSPVTDTKLVVAAVDKAELARQARNILEANCYRCHGKDDAAEGGFKDVLDVRRMIARQKLVPGSAAGSKIYKKIISDEMPPENEKPRPSKAEIAVLAQWLDAGAPAFTDAAVVKERPFRTTRDVLVSIRDHLDKVPSQDRPYQRYFTLTNLHNNKAVKESDLRLARAALSKAINSLSWKNAIVVPEAVDADQSVFAVDIRKLDWDRNNLWHEVLKVYPYGLKHDRDPDEAVQEMARTVYDQTGSDLPYVRADWFIATATRPPLYHTLLRLPQTAGELEEQLKVSIRNNFLKDKLARAGFATSGVSGQNRLVERSESGHGAYWKSYDFKSNDGFGNLFRYPLGPEFAGNSFERQAFKHDGGEIIFNLPNGLQAYLLINGKDERIDEGPIEVVSDALKTSGTAKIVNGLSCMACHGQGMKSDFKDTVRDGTAFQGEPLAKVRRLYPKPEDMKKLLDADSERFLHALQRATGPFLKVGDDKAKDIKDFPEPVGIVARQYILKELTLVDAALELGIDDPALLYGVLKGNDRLRRLGLGPLTSKATIKRETWESLEKFISPYQEVASAMELGTPKRVK